MRHPVLPSARELGLPVVSGILLTLSFPPFQLLVPPFVALVPYLLFVGGSPPDRSGATSVLRATFWMGVVFYGTLLYWLFTALVFYTWLALLGYLITFVVLSGLLAGAGWALHRMRFRHAIPFWVSLPIFWTGVEWLRAHLGDVAFPWLGLGHSLTGFPMLVGFADISGARGVTVWLVAINGLLAEWWLEGLRRRWQLRTAALALLIALPIGYSLIRWHTLQTRPAARVLVVQPNIPEDLKLERAAAVDTSQRALAQLTARRLAGASGVELVVWPETALPTSLERAPGWGSWVGALARSNDVTLLFGFIDVVRYADGGYDYYNAALFVDTEGSPASLYRKHYLVPIIERVPFVPVGWVRSLRSRAITEGWRLPLLGNVNAFLQYFGGFGRGEDEPILRVDDAGFGVLICYESIFPELSRKYRREGADFVVNITNDAWFGRERPWWSRTSALYQHPAHLVMRAIENRMGVARSANTGISLFVDPRGRIREATRLFEPDARVASVETTDGMTLYTRLGDWPGWLSAVGATLLLLWSGWRGRRRADPVPASP
ncbi:MAG: apolipoprotein N-acyltransferase [Gemmatimonadota bacterium]|nr:MAG: apolipoprotein N-acyltransferase [Gemmatimonadota bacterium]